MIDYTESSHEHTRTTSLTRQIRAAVAMSAITSLLIASFHNRPQLLHFNQADAKLELESLSEPKFDGYTWISAHPRLKGIYYAAQRFEDKPGNLSVVKVTASTSSNSSGSKLEILKTYPSHGMDPCHLGLSEDARSIAIANVNTSLPTVIAAYRRAAFVFHTCAS